ncbi:MAG: peptidylprolyl isomerase [Pseudomonadota bacterium]
MFKLHHILLALMGLCLSQGLASQDYEPLDRTIAIVEDDVVLYSQVEQRARQLAAQQPSTIIDGNLRQLIIDQLILETLQLQIAERIKLSIAESDVERAYNDLRSTLAAKQIDYRQYLGEIGLNEVELKTALRDELMIKQVQEGNLQRRIRITDREIDEFLESKAGQEWLTTRLRLGHILLPGDTDQAQAIYEELMQPGAAFDKVAQRVSKGPNAAKGGDLGWRTQDQLPALFLQQVATLKAGDIAEPFRSNAGVHIVKILQRSGAEPVMVQRYQVRHILIKPTVLFTDEEAKAKIDGIYQQLVTGTDFIELAQSQTEDTGSKADGGALGWSTPGQFVPEFERTMKATPVGEISKPFRSQFGWHVLRVDDSKIEDMFETVKRNQVANILRERRFQDELQLWLQELRQEAYVDVLI